MFRFYSKINFLIAFLLCVGSYSSLFSQCNGDITLSTQDQVNNFSCNTVNGNLTISGSGITHLDSLFGILNVLQHVTGNLKVTNCPNLTSLQGLDGIISCGGFIIDNCPNLNTLGNFAYQLQTVSGEFTFEGTGLTSFNIDNGTQAFPFLTSCNNFYIFDNPLTSFSGFNALTNIGNDLSISVHFALTSITGFNALTNIGNDLIIGTNTALTSITGFNALTNIGNDFTIGFNLSLISITNFNALTNIGNRLSIHASDQLTFITGFDNLTQVGSFRLGFSNNENFNLNDVSAFEDLNVSGDVMIVANPQLSICCFAEHMLNTNGGNDIVSGNAAGCQSVAQIMAPPVLSPCPANSTVSASASTCGASVSFTDPGIIDNCGIDTYTALITLGDGTIYFSGNAVPGLMFTYPLTVGNNTFVYIATDTGGNTSSCATTVTVIDNVPPVFPSPSQTITGICGVDDPNTLFFANAPTATDNCGITGYVDPFVDTPGCGSSFTRTYTTVATDVNGNTATFVTTINMVDNTPPVLSGIPADVTIFCGDPMPVLPTVTAADQCAGNVSSSITVASSVALGNCTFNTPGEITTFSWTANDGCMNSISEEWTVTRINNFEFTLGDDVAVCNISNYTISAPSGASYLWSNGATTQIITVSTSGNYTVTITNAGGCCNEDMINVTFGTNPNATATGNQLDCTGAPVVIMASSTTSGVSYAWTGPGGFTSTLQNPSVSVAGTYTVEVTNSQGCTSSANAVVTVNNQTPSVTTTGGSLTCTTTSTMVSATSTTSGVTYAWTGPGGFTSNIANPTVSTAGTYNVIVTAPNNCIANGSALVTANTTPPTSTLTSGVLTCSTTSTQIVNTPSSNASSYAWTGPNNYTSTAQSPSVTLGGAYNLTVTATNGCTSTNQISVTQNTTAPNVTAQGGSIPCGSTSVLLQGNSTTSGVTYTWSGPGGYTSGLQNPLVNIVGTYTLVVTGQNGCTSSATAMVVGDSNAPVVMTTGGSITCTTTSVTMTATSSVAGSTFLWSGPNSFTSTLANPTVTVPGNYLVEVTAPNNCKSNGVIQVINDTAIPSISIALGTVDCAAGTRQIIASTTSTTTGFTWTGPSGFTSNIPNPSITLAGTYVASTVGTNGCIGGQNITIEHTISYTHNITTTKATATEGGTASITLSGGTPNFNIVWDNGTVGLSTTNLTAGNHNVVVVDGLGCTKVIPFVIETTVAVDDTKKNIGITLFPNPVFSELTIDISSSSFSIEKMVIINNLGQVMFSQKFESRMDVSGLPSGLYIIELHGGKEVYGKRFVKK